MASSSQHKHSQSIAEEAIIEADVKLARAGLGAALSKVSKDGALLQENNDTVNRMSSLPKGAVSDQSFYQAKLALQRQIAELATSNSGVLQQKALIRKLEETLLAQKKKTEIFSVQKEKAQLDLTRTRITSPMNGIILRLLEKPIACKAPNSAKSLRKVSCSLPFPTNFQGNLSPSSWASSGLPATFCQVEPDCKLDSRPGRVICVCPSCK